MRLGAATTALAACLLAPASAGAGGARPIVSLTVSPPRVHLADSATRTIRLTNTGSSAVVVEVTRAGFALDLHGRPKIATRTRTSVAAASWLRIGTRRLSLPRNATAATTVRAALPRRPEPGDHDAVVLLTTRPIGASGVAVRTRIGVVVSLRVRGRVVHRLVPLRLHVRRNGRLRLLDLMVANRGNVTETIGGRRVRIELRHSGSVLARLRPLGRDLLPRTRGVVAFRYRGRVHGAATAAVRVETPGRGRSALVRTFRVRL
jgi:hypothetical protein